MFGLNPRYPSVGMPPPRYLPEQRIRKAAEDIRCDEHGLQLATRISSFNNAAKEIPLKIRIRDFRLHAFGSSATIRGQGDNIKCRSIPFSSVSS
jgi:hypothetical protein